MQVVGKNIYSYTIVDFNCCYNYISYRELFFFLSVGWVVTQPTLSGVRPLTS